MSRALLIGLALAALAAVPARAEGSAKNLMAEYDRGGRVREQVVLILDQLALGFSWSNTRLIAREQGPLYCPPTNLALRGADLADMLRKAMDEDATVGDAPYGLAVLRVLEKAFPCG